MSTTILRIFAWVLLAPLLLLEVVLVGAGASDPVTGPLSGSLFGLSMGFALALLALPLIAFCALLFAFARGVDNTEAMRAMMAEQTALMRAYPRAEPVRRGPTADLAPSHNEQVRRNQEAQRNAAPKVPSYAETVRRNQEAQRNAAPKLPKLRDDYPS